jgi:hypothetical protein
MYPAFVTYFRTYYGTEALYVRWIRACYLDGYEGDPARIPTTNAAIECYHGLLKTDELSGRCMQAFECASSVRTPLSLARSHAAGRACARAGWTGCTSPFTP